MSVVNFGIANPNTCDAYRRIKEALGITDPTKKIVIEMNANEVIKVYVVRYVTTDQLAGVADVFDLIACQDVAVADDATVTATGEGV